MSSERVRAVKPTRAEQRFTAQVDAVLAASRVLVGISAQSMIQSMTEAEAKSVAQLRTLVILASRGPMHLAALAEAMGIHPSNATRLCDRLVTTGLLDRRDNPADRRHLLLEPTSEGRRLVESVLNRRRGAIGAIVERMQPADRQELARVLAAFAAAGGEPDPGHLWSMGWTTAGA
jgi:DNA-binding MarR family transcriptional regulator